MKQDRKLSTKIIYILLLIIAIAILFQWYTAQNSRRMEERNKNYAADSARLKVIQIDQELNNALTLINTYTYFLDKTLAEPSVSTEALQEIEANSSFDAIRFTDINGVNYASDGRTSDASERDYYLNGIEGESGISFISSSLITGETMIGFYSPVHYNGEVIGVLRGIYLAEEYLKNMLSTTYFGEEARVFLCTSDGEIIADSDEDLHEENLFDLLVDSNLVDAQTVARAGEIFENGGEGTFICDSHSETDNICVMYLPENDYVLVQAFPKSVTQDMIRSENLIGIQLESMLIGLFAIYIILLLIQERKQKTALEQENREMGYIISGITTLFSRFIMVDLEADTYQYLAGTSSESNELAVSGKYQDFLTYISSGLISEYARQEFTDQMQKDAIVTALAEQNDLRLECHTLRHGHTEWEHINIICLKRQNGNAKKVLIIRQDITELKEKELRIQAEIARANRKERQYRIAITSNAIYTFDFNLTNDWIEDDIVIRTKDGRQVYMLDEVGMEPPYRASEWFERQKQLIPMESLEEYSAKVNIEHLKECFERGEAEAVVQYWIQDFIEERKICIRQSFIMTKDGRTGDIMVMVVTKEITDSVRKQMEQTQALKDALIQAQHANKAKNTFLSNMSHDIRTPMNAIIGFTTIALSHIDDKEEIESCLQNVLSSSSQLLDLLDDVLNMSRIESGNIQIKEQACSISELIHHLVDTIQPQAKAKQQNLLINTCDVTDEAVIADSIKLNQIFINLLNNAVKYTPVGGNIIFQITQKSSFHSTGYANYVFIIRDNGIGMSPKFLDHIFEPFERESSATKTGILGSGLGLTITKSIVDLMNGTISVQSEPGKGSTFTVELTLKLQGLEKNTECVKKISGRRALILEHDPCACGSIGKMLRQFGMRSEQTASVSEALHHTKAALDAEEAYYAYIIDWPEEDRLETVKKIRRISGDDAVIIILTASDWSAMEEEAKAAGVTAFCKKPLFMSDLKSALLAADNTNDKPDTKTTASSVDFNGKRILLAEDIELNRKIAELMLVDAGFSVEHAPDGTDAVAMVKNSEEYYYDAILMDLQMPVMDGYEAAKTIRALPRTDVKTIPIIAVTANALEEDKESVLRCGMNAHVAKPLNRKVFLKTLEQFIK